MHKQPVHTNIKAHTAYIFYAPQCEYETTYMFSLAYERVNLSVLICCHFQYLIVISPKKYMIKSFYCL